MNNKMKIISVFLIIAILMSSLALAVCAAPEDESTTVAPVTNKNPEEEDSDTVSVGSDEDLGALLNGSQSEGENDLTKENDEDVAVDTNTESSDGVEDYVIDEEWLENSGYNITKNNISFPQLREYSDTGSIKVEFTRIKDKNSKSKMSFSAYFRENSNYAMNIPEDIIAGEYKIKIKDAGNFDEIKLKTNTIYLSKDAGSVVIEASEIIKEKSFFQLFIGDNVITLLIIVNSFIGYTILKNKRLSLESDE